MSHFDLFAIPLAEASAARFALLPPVVRSRALALREGATRARFVSGRLAVRAVLGARLGIPPAEVDLRSGPFGAPELHGARWRFSVAHAERWVVLALSQGAPVGLDIERLRPFDDAGCIARQNFHADEVAGLMSMAGERRAHAFLRLWVRKEAVVKAARRGLSMRLDTWSVWRSPLEQGPLVRADAAGRRWWVHDVDLVPGHAIAVAAVPGAWAGSKTRTTLDALMGLAAGARAAVGDDDGDHHRDRTAW